MRLLLVNGVGIWSSNRGEIPIMCCVVMRLLTAFTHDVFLRVIKASDWSTSDSVKAAFAKFDPNQLVHISLVNVTDDEAL